ncbi:MAG: hypothetical protein K2Z80_03730 [Xanthobacteraceae bacterium]|nr:hypothetical protein [Xanthobacteraceae bacterium]
MSLTFWADERVATLKRLWAANWTAREIAELLGCTRNAVLGKACRLGLPVSIHCSGATPSAAPVAMVQAATVRAVTAEPVSRQIALADLKPGECGWISGDDCRCCGHATAQMLARGRRMASPYCGVHSARAYRQKQSA